MRLWLALAFKFYLGGVSNMMKVPEADINVEIVENCAVPSQRCVSSPKCFPHETEDVRHPASALFLPVSFRLRNCCCASASETKLDTEWREDCDETKHSPVLRLRSCVDGIGAGGRRRP